jgi:hypothetical protein
MPTTHTYQELLELNSWIRKNSDTWYLHCTTRTVQESKLFPTPAYMSLSYLQAFYRYPTLLRKLADAISPEELGDRLREVNTKATVINLSCIPEFYLAGRQFLIDMGMLKPTDALDDLCFVEDFAKRLNLSYHRNHAHVLPYDAGLRAQVMPERRAQVFEADAIGCKPDDRLHHSLQKFLATANQYSFLAHCECRLGIHNHGPYKCGPNHEMLVRGFVDLAEGDLPWLDGVAAEVTHNNLTIPVILKDTHFHIVDDWASFEATPSYDHDNVVAVGLYTSDFLSDGEIPVAMDNAATLADFLDNEEQILHRATRALWKEVAEWSRDQMLDAGASVYFSVAKDLFHVAGIYEQDDWFMIDERADRVRPLLNDEYARDFLGELLGYLSLPSQQGSPYTMSKHADSPGNMWWTVPYSVLADESSPRRPAHAQRWDLAAAQALHVDDHARQAHARRVQPPGEGVHAGDLQGALPVPRRHVGQGPPRDGARRRAVPARAARLAPPGGPGRPRDARGDRAHARGGGGPRAGGLPRGVARAGTCSSRIWSTGRRGSSATRRRSSKATACSPSGSSRSAPTGSRTPCSTAA